VYIWSEYIDIKIYISETPSKNSSTKPLLHFGKPLLNHYLKEWGHSCPKPFGGLFLPTYPNLFLDHRPYLEEVE